MDAIQNITNKTIQNFIQEIKKAQQIEEKQILTVQGLLEIFGFKRAGLYFYSPISKIGEGIIRMDEKGIESIKDVREDVRKMPPIYEAIKEQKPKHLNQAQIRQLPAKYTEGITDLLIVPLHNGSNTVGYVGMSRYQAEPIDKKLIDSLIDYGKLIGAILGEEGQVINRYNLNNRELEILQKLAWGESNKEMANSLEISIFTVQDHVKSIINKMGVLNRVQAVAVGIREGIVK